jgi:hypothetical protein
MALLYRSSVLGRAIKNLRNFLRSLRLVKD